MGCFNADDVTWSPLNGSSTAASSSSSSAATSKWSLLSDSMVNIPSARIGHTAVWNDTAMLVWGGVASGGTALGDGASYNPTTNSWSVITTTNAPTARSAHTAVWATWGAGGLTKAMIVWGGSSTSCTGSVCNTGARYDSAVDSWTATATLSVPLARRNHTAIYNGTNMIVWGGRDGGTTAYNSGGKYTPSSDAWTGTDTTDPDLPVARYEHAAVWSGTYMIIWGGNNGAATPTFFSNGALYDSSGNVWLPMTSTTLEARAGHSSVWTGTEMFVGGGYSISGGTTTYYRNGGAFNPSGAGAWGTYPAPPASFSARAYHTAIWDSLSARMIIWGGVDGSAVYQDGAILNPSTTTWSWNAADTSDAPVARAQHTAVWAGDKMIVFGGRNFGDTTRYGNGGYYMP